MIMTKDQNLARMSAIVILTYRSASSLREAICFFMASRTAGLSNRCAMSLYTFTQTSRMLATGSLAATLIAFSMASR